MNISNLYLFLFVHGLENSIVRKNRTFGVNVLYIQKKESGRVDTINVINNDKPSNKKTIVNTQFRSLTKNEISKLVESNTVKNVFPMMKNMDLDYYEMWFEISVDGSNAKTFTLTAKNVGKPVQELIKCKIIHNPYGDSPYIVDIDEGNLSKFTLFCGYKKDIFVFLCFEKDVYDTINTSFQEKTFVNKKEENHPNTFSELRNNKQPVSKNKIPKEENVEEIKTPNNRSHYSTTDKINTKKDSPYNVVLISYYKIIEKDQKQNRDRFTKSDTNSESNSELFCKLFYFIVFTFILLFCIAVVVCVIKAK